MIVERTTVPGTPLSRHTPRIVATDFIGQIEEVRFKRGRVFIHHVRVRYNRPPLPQKLLAAVQKQPDKKTAIRA